MAPCPALAARIRGDHPSPSTAFTSAFPSRSAEASAKSQAPAASSSLCSSRASHWYVCVTVSRHAPWTQELVPASKYTCKRTQSLRSDTRGSKHAKELSTLPRAAQTTLRARRSARRLDDVFLSWPHAGTANVCLRGRGRTRSWPASPRQLLPVHHPLRPPSLPAISREAVWEGSPRGVARHHEPWREVVTRGPPQPSFARTPLAHCVR